ncbi:anthrone oxygenase family protein [Streptomyces niger]|uniref:anthrone oxygenase family protein n=1 Tax=Streptomyces niger TaxID=66373 RepID=UPI00389A9015
MYGVSVLVTLCVNLPLNRRLARHGTPRPGIDLTATRREFERPWRAANVVRTPPTVRTWTP